MKADIMTNKLYTLRAKPSFMVCALMLLLSGCGGSSGGSPNAPLVSDSREQTWQQGVFVNKDTLAGRCNSLVRVQMLRGNPSQIEPVVIYTKNYGYAPGVTTFIFGMTKLKM